MGNYDKGTIVKDKELQPTAVAQRLLDGLAEPARIRLVRFIVERYGDARKEDT